MQKNKKTTPVAVIGLGCLFPKAPGVREYWRLISQGEDAISEVPETHWSKSDFYNENQKAQDHLYCTRGGYLSPVSFNPAEFGIPPNIIEATDTSQLLSLVVAKMALEDAGYGNNREFDRDKASVILGVTGTQELVITMGSRLSHPKWKKAIEDSGIPKKKKDEIINRISDSFTPWQENSFPGLLGNVVAGRIANRFNFGGTNTVLDSACASSLSALNLSFMELQTGRSDIVLSGGVDTLNDIFMHMCFSQTGVLSFSGDIRPFSASADGTILGEGIGMVVLKRLEDAKKDNDKIYAVLKSVGASSDGKALSIYAPNAKGQAKALKMAYQEAEVSPSSIEIIEAHGTGTKGDSVEFQGLKDTFGKQSEQRNWCALGSVKSNIGHTKAAAGVAGLIKGILSLHHKVLPPTLKIDKPADELNIADSPFYLCTTARPWLSKQDHPRRCGVSSCGFGGSNFHAVLEEYQQEKNCNSWTGAVEILAFSAETTNVLIKQLKTLAESIDKDLILQETDRNFSYEAQQTRKRFNSSDPYRLLLVINKSDKVKEIIEKALHKINDKAIPFSEQTIFFGTPDAAKGKLGFIFPGQGSQYTGMGLDLINTFADASAVLEKAACLFNASDKRLGDIIYPLPDHITDKKSNEALLRKTDNAQPAIGTISLAMAKILSQFGLKPDATCGHSFGELSALCSAGWIDEETLIRLSVKRGQFMASCGNNAGTMLAVNAPIDELSDLIKKSGIDLILANKNTYNQGVLSGSSDAIEEADRLCKEKAYRTTKLPVAAAFHSSLVEAAATPFQKELETISFSPTDIPVLSNTTGDFYPANDSAAIKKILGSQILQPVEFIQNIEKMYDKGIRTFVEVGPKSVLSGLVKAILQSKNREKVTIISTDASSGRKSGISDLAKVLCQLASSGFSVDLSNWEEKTEKPEKQMMSIQLTGANQKPVAKEKPKTRLDIPQELIDRRIKQLQPAIINQTNDIKQKTTTPKTGSTQIKNQITEKQQDTNSVIMKPNTTHQPSIINEALSVVQEGLRSMQAIQAQTAEAHNRFLDAQTEAGKTLQLMMERTQQMAETAVGTGETNTALNTYTPAPCERVYTEPPVEEKKEIRQPMTENIGATTTLAASDFQPDFQAEPQPVEGFSHKIETALLDVVSELTGYPVEMIGPEMDLEADLGIDSIKRVEILSTFEERIPDLPPADPERMSALKTLGEISAYLAEISAYPEKISAYPEKISGDTGTKTNAISVQSKSFDSKQIESTLLDVVSELTGYPVEMIGPEMDLEADLGIDSIKRVEILSTFEEKIPDLPPADPERMSALKTLGEISAYLAEISAYPEQISAYPEQISGNTGIKTNAISVQSKSFDSKQIESTLLDVVSELTGYPVEMIGPEMDLEADLGIDSIKRVEILSTFEERIPELPPADPERMSALKTLGEISAYLAEISAYPGKISENTGTKAEETSVQPKSFDPKQIESTLLDVVSRLTGYPVEMLDPEMDIEADLGIDSIKRVEIMSEFEERMPDLPTVDPDIMGQLKTLEQIRDYLSKPVSEASAGHEPDPACAKTPKADKKNAAIDRQIVTFKSTPLNTENPILIPAGKKAYVSDDSSGLGAEIVRELKANKIAAELLCDETEIENAAGLVIIPDIKAKGKQNSLWNKKDEAFLLQAFELAKKAASDLIEAAEDTGAFFATITKLDGKFGFTEGKINSPITGGLAGLSKTAALEWEKVNCKAIDIAPDFKENKAIAQKIIAELLHKGAVEIGLDKDERFVSGLESKKPDLKSDRPELGENDVVVISGGAKGVTAAAAIALAQKVKTSFVLIGRSAKPEPEPVFLQGLSDEKEINKAILANDFKGQKPTPVELNKAFKRYMGAREITRTLEKIEAAGSKAAYFSCDVRDEKATETIFHQARETFGPVKAIIHGAGVLEDRFIVDKTTDQFKKVYSTKVGGLYALLKAAEKDKLNYLVLFSSVSARIGNSGQVDYAVANEVLNKAGRFFAYANPDCHVTSINWGPWDGGMVTTALKKEFTRRKIALIPLEQGAQSLVAEMAGKASEPVEVVIGATITPGFKEETDKPEANNKAKNDTQAKKSRDNLSLAFKQEVDTKSFPILSAHKINNTPVVPFALMTEWIGHSALHNNPGLTLFGINDMRLLKGIKIKGNGNGSEKAKTIRLMSGKAVKKDNFFEVPVEIRNGHQKNDTPVIHSKGTAILSDSVQRPPQYTIPVELLAEKYTKDMEEAYETVLFHGNELKGIQRVEGCTSKGMVATLASAPPPSEWIAEPFRTNWIADPLILDSAYQMAILWCHEEKGLVSLPSFSRTYRQYTREFPQDGITAVMEVNDASGHKMRSDFTFLNKNNDVVATISGYEAVMDDSLRESFKNSAPKKTDEPLFSREKLLAYATGKPSEAFGKPYEMFDNEKIIARLPGPPYFFMDAVRSIDHKAWELSPGGWIEAEYMVRDDDWYFKANRSASMPFCVLLEIALQPCGFLAAYAGSALRSDQQLKFRNLGGNAVLHRELKKGEGKLTMRTRLTKVAEAAGMIIEEFDIQVLSNNEIIYEGDTNFGFFTNATMAQQVGIRSPETIIYTPAPEEIARGRSSELNIEAPLTPDDTAIDPFTSASMPAKALLMLDTIEIFVPDGGPAGLGYIKGIKEVNPDEWFFKAHFYQDPVCPGSLGLESFIQLIKFAALEKWPELADTRSFEFLPGCKHNWIYRGQVVPENKKIEVSAIISNIKDGDEPEITADGYLCVDGLLIYQMKNFTLKLVK